MKELAFVIWLMGYPFLTSISESYRMQVTGERYSLNVKATSALVHLFVWIIVAVHVWRM